MNCLKKFVLATSLVFFACSDMSVDTSDVAVTTTVRDGSAQLPTDYFSNPADFDLDVYLEINKDVKYFQIIQEVRNRNYAFRDSMRMAKDSIEVDGVKTSIAAYMTARFKADTAAFIHSDTAFTHKVFLMTGYGEDLWDGVENINSEQRTMMVRFNLIQNKKPSIKEDKEFIENFKYESALLESHYSVYGAMEGRAYRYCKDAKEIGLPKAEIPPDTLGSGPFVMDYNRNRFCLNKEDGLVYAIK